LWNVLLDGQPLFDEEGQPVALDSYNPTPRYELNETFTAPAPGEHLLRLEDSAEAPGDVLYVHSLEILPPIRQSSLGAIIGLIAAVEVLGLGLAWLLGRPLFGRLAAN
jgi:hypothetical protein